MIHTLCVASLLLAGAHAAFLSSYGSGWGVENVTQHSGFITVNTKVDNGGHIFFWLFESRNNPSTDPLVLWMTGGPGCSSELAIFYEQGPYRFLKDGTVGTNEFAWNEVANVIFVDQPVGTGFSYADHMTDYVTNEDQVAEDMYEFMQGFYASFPQYKGVDFYVTGESYAGHYVPAVSNRIFQANKKKEGPFDIPLKGFAIGNGLVNPLIQYAHYGDYSRDNKLINSLEAGFINKVLVPACEASIKTVPAAALVPCNMILAAVKLGGRDFNTYDIREKCTHPPLCYDFSPLDKVMSQKEVRNSLGVFASDHWSQCDMQVHTYLMGDWMKNCEEYIPEMLNSGIRALVYSGKEDFICNWYGGRAWVREMEWNGHTNFVPKVDNLTPWTFKGKLAGEFATEGPLTFLGINDAGHMVPMDQPEVALEMLSRFIRNKPFA